MTTNQEDLLAIADRVLLKSYRQQPIVMARGKGLELWDAAGRRYLDMTSGIAVCCLGHAHPKLAEAIAAQAETLLHTSNLYFIEEQILAAKAITERSFADRVFFCNSGAEANEGALKLARRYQHVVAGRPDRNLFVSTHASFHGRTMATVSITGQEKYRAGFGPLIEHVTQVPFGDLAAATEVLDRGEACAFIVEPIQAEGGIHPAPDGYLAGLREACDRTGTILIFDEVQTGVGRTGRWFGHQHDCVEPHVMTLAKGLGGGVPVGAVAASEEAARGLTFREGGAVPHASTFGGNPLACAAARTVLRVIDEEGLLANTEEVGAYLGEQLDQLAAAHPALATGSRGRGFLRGLVMREAAGPIYAACRTRGLLVSVAGGTVLRFAPALIAERAHIDEAIGILDSVLKETTS